MLNNKCIFRCINCTSEKCKDLLNTPSFVIDRCECCGYISTILIDKKIRNYREPYSSIIEAKKHLETQKTEFSKFASDILEMVNAKSGKLLDVGCGFGWVVAEANKRGFEAFGIDSSKVYTNLGKKTLNVNLKCVSLEKFKTKEKFDVVVLNHVLEHIEQPISFLEKVRKLLRPGGEIFIACPNIESLMFWIFKEKWYGLQPDQHVSQFTPESIENIVKKSGFEFVDVSTGSLYYNPTGFKKYVFQVLCFVAWLFGIGDQVFVNAKNPL